MPFWCHSPSVSRRPEVLGHMGLWGSRLLSSLWSLSLSPGGSLSRDLGHPPSWAQQTSDVWRVRGLRGKSIAFLGDPLSWKRGQLQTDPCWPELSPSL